MPIRVYPSLLPGEPVEVHEVEGQSFAGWLASKNVDFRARAEQPILVKVNGVELPVTEWESQVLGRADEVEVRILPHGGVFKALGSIISKIFDFAFGWLIPNNRSSSGGSAEQGQRLEPSQAKANQARLGEVVPELGGRYRRFPDYLTPPRRYFVNRREQWLEFMCCLGPGSYHILDADVKVGDTTFSSLGPDASYALFSPGAYVGATQAHEHWYSVDEVGGTSSGTAGLELSAAFSSDINPSAPAYSVNGFDLVSAGADFPTGWGPGTVLEIEFSRDYVVSTETIPAFPDPIPVNRFTGNFLDIGPATGKAVRFTVNGTTRSATIGDHSVDSAGEGWVQLYDALDGHAIDDVPDGTESMRFYIQGRRYRVTAIVSADHVQVVAVDDDMDVPGWAGFGPYTGPMDIRVDPATVYGDWSSTFRCVPAGELTDTFELDFFFPNGLAYVENDGDLSNHGVRIEVQYRDARVGAAFASVGYSYSERTLDQIGFTERISLGAQIAPEARVRRVGAQDTSTQVNDTVQWYGLRSRLPTRTSYPNWTTMAVKLRSGGRLGAQSENQINVIATRVLPVLAGDGQWLAPQPTRDISAFVRYIAHSIGYTDADLYMEELQRLHNIWSSRGETFDYVHEETTVKEAINLALGAGMAEMTIHDGQIMPVRDDVRTQFEQSYSPQNMTGPLRRSFRARRIDDADGVEVEFTNSETWTQETVRCLLPGDNGFKLEKLTIKGVTDRTRAWRIGMRRRRVLRYRNWEYAFATEMDALNSRYLSYVPLIDGDPGYGVSAILEHIEPSGGLALMHLSEPLGWTAGQDHVVAFRRPDGSLAGPFNANPGPDEYSVLANITEAWPVVTLNQEPPHIYFGTLERWCFPALIKNISPRGLAAVDVEAENYDVRVYASDNQFPPA